LIRIQPKRKSWNAFWNPKNRDKSGSRTTTIFSIGLNAPARDNSRILGSIAAVGAMENGIEMKRRLGMDSHKPQHGAKPETELTIQEASDVATCLVFHIVAVWSVVSYWLRFRRVCAWHEPKQKRIGGNPFARRTTHGICPECFARVSAEIISHGETHLRVSVTKAWQQGGASLPAPPACNCAVPAWLQRPSAGDMDSTRPAVLRGKSDFSNDSKH
jgi:hypothetical protein